ncbi:MAG: hypothetical protein ACP6IY_09400 [Promethearchaeia archaeon]
MNKIYKIENMYIAQLKEKNKIIKELSKKRKKVINQTINKILKIIKKNKFYQNQKIFIKKIDEEIKNLKIKQ